MSLLEFHALFPAKRGLFAQDCKMHILLLLSFCLLPCYGEYQDDDWIDPTDMLNYDAATGRMKNRPQYTSEEVALKEITEEKTESTCLSENMECKMSVENLKQEIEDCRNTKDLKLPPSNSDPVFKRYLHKILNEAERVGFPDNSQPEVHYDAEVVLTKEMLMEIQKFLQNADWNLGALDEALSRTLVHFKHHNVEEWRWKFEDYFGLDVFTAFMISLCLLCIVIMITTEMWTRIGWLTQIKRLCVISFVISLGWNWMYLYKVAFAERQAEVAKMGMFDGSCGEKISWYESLYEWWKTSSSFQNDPCEEYFKSVLIHPALMVPPTKALALTFTDFITEPLKHVGKGIGEFLNNLLGELPYFYQLPVLILLALVVLVFCYGTGRSIGQIGTLRNNRDRHERLPIGEPHRPFYGQFIEGGNRQPYHEQLPHQPAYVVRYGDPSNQRPEILRAVDYVEVTNHQKPLPSCSGMTSTLQEGYTGEQQRKKETLEEKSFGQVQSKNGTVEEKTLGQPQRKNEIPEDKSFGQKQRKDETREEQTFGLEDKKQKSLPNNEYSDKTLVPNDYEQQPFPAIHKEVILKQTDIETLKSTETSQEENGHLEKQQPDTVSLLNT